MAVLTTAIPYKLRIYFNSITKGKISDTEKIYTIKCCCGMEVD